MHVKLHVYIYTHIRMNKYTCTHINKYLYINTQSMYMRMHAHMLHMSVFMSTLRTGTVETRGHWHSHGAQPHEGHPLLFTVLAIVLAKTKQMNGRYK